MKIEERRKKKENNREENNVRKFVKGQANQNGLKVVSAKSPWATTCATSYLL